MIVDDPVDAAETLNTDLAKMHDWSMKWLVKFKTEKSKLIPEGHPHKHSASQSNNRL
jgi:hypothetical protein